MAVTINLYDHTAKLFANKEVDFTGLKVVLLDSSGTFTASDTQYSDISANEVSGNGWSAGGMALSGVAVTNVTTNDAMLDATDLSVTASGGAIGPAENAVIRDVTNNKLIAHISFGASQTAGVGTPFLFTWNASGIISWTV
jgi:hypothetical protein